MPIRHFIMVIATIHRFWGIMIRGTTTRFTTGAFMVLSLIMADIILIIGILLITVTMVTMVIIIIDLVGTEIGIITELEKPTLKAGIN